MRWPTTLVLLLLLPAGLEAREPERAGPRAQPWIGFDGADALDEASLDPRRLDALGGAGPLLVRTRPIAWERIVPVAPLADGRQLHDWARLDAFVEAWQHRGAELVLVLEPRAAWAATPPESSAFVAKARTELSAKDVPLARAAATGLMPPARWQAWQRFVRDVVERYDKDGEHDAPGLLRTVRWIQVMDGPSSPETWIGSPGEYARLLHHALLGARQASPSVRVAHGGVELAACTGLGTSDPVQLGRSLAKRLRDEPALRRFEARWGLAFATQSLGISRVYQAAACRGRDHAASEEQTLRLFEGLLRQIGRSEVERWLTRSPAAKVQGGGDVAERRVRTRWLAAARGQGRERAKGRAWLDRGRAYDVVRTLVHGLLGGADRVFLGHAVEGGRDDARPLAVFVEPDDEGGWWRRAPWYALRQATRHLGHPKGVQTLPTAGDTLAVRVTRDLEGPWIVVALPDPDRSWGGNPREEPEAREIAIHLAPGSYRIEHVALGPEGPDSEVVAAPEGVLRMRLGPGPVYVTPVAATMPAEADGADRPR